MQVTVISGDHPSWNHEIDRFGILLGAPNNIALFPYHFLAVALRRIGGLLATFEEQEQTVAVGFLFPRLTESERGYTLRYHPLSPQSDTLPGQVTALVSGALGNAPIHYYDAYALQRYVPTAGTYGALEIGRPSLEEANAIRDIQADVWGSPPEFLYPIDIHSQAFALPTSLVARVDGKLAGFLFGFDKIGGPPLPLDWQERFNGSRRIESQTMGVLPEYRGMRIGFLLKRAQAEEAWNAGIGVINWTVDPLQFPNAALNFGLLRAVAYDFYPDLYPFRNELNRVHASRFAITWLVGSRRVRETPLFGARSQLLNLAHHRNIARVNRGWTDVNYTLTNALIAIEIPADWNGLQRTDLESAVAWRATTDRIFTTYLGRRPGQYVVTGAGIDGERRYLIAERVEAGLWDHLGRALD
jgi:predicted GNAT superfamily acetyltransferase